MKDKVGLYLWAGPGTERMLNLKYFNPKMDKESIYSSYDYEYLAEAKEKLGVTDVWVTYSWGFAPETEKQDYEFIISRLDNFRRLDLKVHAYIQGPNLVYSEFPDRDWWCVDELGRPIPYHRGRRVISMLSPEFSDYKIAQIRDVADAGFDGVYVDNIQMGQMGAKLLDGGALPFVGSQDKYTEKEFLERYGAKVPSDLTLPTPEVLQYLDFRVDVTSEFLQKLAREAQNRGLLFGSNSFDPKLDTKITFGTDLQRLDEIQDYLLFENHSFPKHGVGENFYVQQLQGLGITKPVFVLSYNHGIGRESGFSQSDFEALHAEDKLLDFYSVYKGTEYVTNGIWHNLYLDRLKKLREVKNFRVNTNVAQPVVHGITTLVAKRFRWASSMYNPLSRFYLESRWGRAILNWFYYLILH